MEEKRREREKKGKEEKRNLIEKNIGEEKDLQDFTIGKVRERFGVFLVEQ